MSQLTENENKIGLAFPLQLQQEQQEDGSVITTLMTCSYEEHIKQSLRTLLLTARGERVMRPEFGNSLGAYLFENIGTTTASLIKHEVISTVERYEPRIELTDVHVHSSAQDPGVLSLELVYTINSTAAPDRLSLNIRR